MSPAALWLVKPKDCNGLPSRLTAAELVSEPIDSGRDCVKVGIFLSSLSPKCRN